MDPMGMDGGDPNLYRCEGNDPTALLDPSGLKPPGGKALDSGGFDVTGPKETHPDGGFGSKITITFTPNDTCKCEKIEFIQIVRPTNLDGSLSYPTVRKGALQPGVTPQGWRVD